MAGWNIGFGPRGVLPEQKTQDPAARRSTIDKLATDTQVPANVLMALEEAGEPAEKASSRLSAEIKAGKRVEDVVPAEMMSRAYDIADTLYPAQKTEEKPKDEPGVISDTMRQMGGALVSGIGSMGEAAGAVADIYADGGVKLDPKTSMVGDMARAAGGAVREAGEEIKAGVSEAGKEAMEGSMPDGDLLDPSTWTMGENPSLRGYTMLAADVLGSFLPVVATAVITKNPAASAMVGGAQGGGSAVETARDTILEMSRTQHPDGGTVLQHESAYYRGLIEAGIPPDEAVRRTSQAAEKMAMLLTTPVSMFGGAATGKILGPGVGALSGRGMATQVIGHGVLSSAEEGLQEAAETYATRTGINAGAETDLNPSEGTFGDFILGALGGGIPGAAAGAMHEKTGGDGSAPGSAAVPEDGLSPPVGAGPGAAATEPPITPTGPVSSVAGLAPDLTPVPEPEPPAPKFPDFKPGKEVRLADPETGAIHDAVFISETPGGVIVRIAGGEFEIGREEFDASRRAATTADEEAAGKKPKAKKAKVDSPAQPPVEPVAAPGPGMLDTAAADALKEQGYYDGPWNDQNMPKPGTLDAPKLSEAAKPAPAPKRAKESLADLTPEEAMKRAKMLEDRAAEGGWTRPMREKHQRLKAIAGAQDGKATETGGPDTGKRAGDAGKPAGNQPGRGARDAGLAAPRDGGAAAAPGQRVPVDQVRPDGAPDDDGALTARASSIATPPEQRIQPDMLGGADTTEAAMAAREKTRKEWGRFLAIAEAGKSQDDSMLEGREVLIRGGSVRIRAQNGKASDQDIRIDTAGMDRDQIAAAVRGAMNELDRRAPLPTSSRAEASDAGAPAAPVRGSEAAGESPKDSEAGAARPGSTTPHPGEVPASSAPDQTRDTKSVVAEKAAKAEQKPSGLLSVLSDDKQARAAELKKKLAAKMRNQVSSGLDPEYITLGGELVKLYIEAGAKRFGQMLADFAESTGLTMKQAQEPLRAAYNHVRDNMELEGEDVSGMDDARAVLEEARKAIQGEEKPAKPAPEPKPPVPRAADRPTGRTYRLENALTPAERRLMASARDGGHYVGEVFAELDNAARRANADLASRDLDVEAFDDTGNRDGKPDQMAWFIREAEAHAKDLIGQVKAEGAENIEPLAKDEDTGDWEYDGTPLSNALEFLDQQYAMGLGVDEDVTPGPLPYGQGDATPMDPEKVFPAPAKGGTRNLDAIADRDGFIPMDEAEARLAFWKKTAAKIGSTTKNRDKVILSLFDYKGTWSQPWRDAGYTVLQHDIKTGSDLISDAWIYERIEEVRKEGKEVYGVLSACPCTTFTGSGARWWAERHDVESPEALRQVFGDRALSSGAKSALEYNIMLADATREAVRLANPTGFHVLENPIGRIQDKAKFPDPLARFHPHNFGDPYTKRTQLFGDFKADLPLANVDPVEGSKMQNKLRGSDPLGKEDRSTTPEGFAYAFFMANDPDARKVKDAPPARMDAETRRALDNVAAYEAKQGKDQKAAEPVAAGPVIEDIREKAAVLRGVPKDQAPDIPGVSLKWDDRDGGFVFSRKHKDTVQAAIKTAAKPAPTADEVTAAAAVTAPAPTPAQAEAENYKTGKVDWRGLTLSIENAKGSERAGFAGEMPPVPDGHVRMFRGEAPAKKLPEWIEQGLQEKGVKDVQGRWFTPSLSIAMWYVRDAGTDARLVYVDVPRSVYQASRVTDNEGARKFSRDPDNENLLPREWSDKAKPTPAKAWSVEMPAHYGRILGTTGADGDHVDFYMGPDPKSEMVWIIDQRDMKTGEFDEHKVMIGFKDAKAAKDAYFAGFSDGNGPLRLMSMTPMGYVDLVMNLKHNAAIWKGPISATNAGLPEAPAKAPVVKSTSPAANRAFPDFKGKLNGPYYDDRSEDGRFNAEKNAFHEAGLSFFRAAAKILKENGWTEAMPRNGKGKPINPVTSNRAGPAVLGEVSITLMGPDGQNGIYAQLGESFNGGNRAQMMWRINQATNPYGSGVNQFLDPTGMTPQEFAEKVIEAHGRWAKKTPDQVKAATAPTPENINAAMLQAAKASGRLEIIGMDEPAAAPDGSAFEAVGMVKGKAASEDAWFRKQAEKGGIAHYKARAVAGGWKLTRDFQPEGTTAPPTRQLGTFSTVEGAIGELRASGMRTGVPEEIAAPPVDDDRVLTKRRQAREAGEAAAKAGRPRQVPGWTVGTEFADEWLAGYAVGKTASQPVADQDTSTVSEADRIARRSQRAPWSLAGATKTTLTEDEAFELGQKHFRDGYARLVPSEITMKHGHAASAWYRGWDRANLDEPMPDTDRTPPEPVDRVIEGTVDLEPDGSEAVDEITVAREGPWDFTTVYPSPDPVQVGRLEVEGRSPFDANTPEEVVSILDETMFAAVDQRATANRWAREIQTIEDGGKPTFTVPKGRDPLEEAEKSFRTANQAFDDTIGAIQDVWGEAGAKAFRKEASDRAAQSQRENPEPEAKAPPIPTPSTGLVSPDSSDPEKSATIGSTATGKPRNEQRRNKRRDQGQPDLFAGTGGAVDGAGRSEAERDRDGRGEGDEDPAGSQPGSEPSGSLVGDQGRLPDRQGVAPPNFTISTDFALGSGTEGQKLEANLAALRLVQKLEAENRFATPEEQAVLARWVGWGGLKTVFDEKHKGSTNQWGRAQAELKALLTKTEYFDAMRSTNDAHYTSRTVVDAMWGAMRNFGFTGGRALEPTIGSGNFLGLQPADLSAQTEWFASELDPVTGKIAKHLYPRATVFDGTGFQDAPFRPATFDIAIGNPPFGGDNSRVGNKKMHPDLGRMKVHNFVIAKTGQLLREGGIMGMVVTHRFLDAMDAEARDVLAPNFHFLGAVRLPNTAFKANAGTEVTTDIVFFQKRRAGDEQGDTSWMQSGAAGPNGTKLNAWFANNPDMILGRPAMDGTMYAGGRRGEGEFTVHDDGRDLGKALDEALAKIKASLPDRVTQLEDAVTAPKTVSTLAYGEMVLTADGRIFRGEQDEARNPVIEEITRETFWKANAAGQFDLVQALRPFAEADLRDATIEQRQRVRDAAVAAGLLDLAGDTVTMSTKFEQALADAIPALLYGRPTQAHRDAFAEYAKKVEAKRLGTDGFDRLKAILDLRGRTLALIRAERNDDPAMEQVRGGLRAAYGEFKAKYGFLNSSKNEAILQGQVGAEMALEIHYKPAKDGREESATVAPIQTQRVIFPHKLPERMDSVGDAVHVSMQEKGYIDPLLIAQLTDKTGEEVIAELTSGEKPLAFMNPATSRFELAESYLSGNLAEKIEKATAARAYEHIPHLKSAMPPPKTQNQITPSIRSMWIPHEVFQDFLRAMGYRAPAVLIAEKVGMAAVHAGDRTPNDFGDQFRGGDMTPGAIFEHALKGKIPVVYDTIRTADGDKRVKNEEKTKDAVAAYERISAEFPNWAYANPLRAQTIIDAFNAKVNVVTPRKYEGTRYLRTVGTSPLVELRNSQKNGAWRMIQDKTVLLHHVVGAGKTMTGITGVMERKRMGLTRKAVVVVPNHLTGQWGKEWLELYPAANILVPTEKDFEPANRAKLINRIATGDFDAVIIGHSQLVKIDNDPEIVAAYIAEQMDALNDAMQEAKKSGDSRRTVGQMANRIAKLREKLERMNEELEKRRGTGLLAWHELGVDMMVLDESQEFKNLEYATTATQLVGMNDPGGSQKAFDLLMKLRALQAMPNSNMTFMTGTPISNSLVEIYSVMKYLIPESLRAMGIEHFDAWKAAFIQDQSRFEYTASMQLKERNVMSGMVNLGPLAELYRSFADIVMRPDVERMYREQMEAKNAANAGGKQVSTRFPTPKIKGGKRRIMLAPPTQNMEEFTRYLVMRMGGIANATDKKAYASVDNPLWVLTDARKASVDIRTIDPTMGREEGSKVARAGAEVFRIWEANKDRRGAQMVFCDMSTPSKTATKAATAILKEAYGKLGLKKDALKRRFSDDEGKSFAARWSDVLGEVESLISSPDTPEATRDALNLWMATPDVQDAPAAMFTADTGFSFYDDLRALLIERGIPEKEIAFIHDYDSTAKKKDLFEAVNEGKVRVLLGSTMKMGAGTNAQRRLVALHHIDAPWRPSDMEQREGRIIRQGNLFYEQDPDGFEVEIIAYSTEKTADVVQWQVLERKAKAIETFLGAAADSLVEEGGDADQYAEFMAQSTGKKVFLDKMQAEKDLLNARGRIASSLRSKSEAESFLESFDEKADSYRAEFEALDQVTIDAFPEGASDFMADYRAKVAAYRIARDKAEAEAEEVRKYNVGRERKDWKKLPEQPNAPKRWAERPTNAYEAAVHDTLIRAQGDPGSDVTKKVQLGNGFHIGVWSETPQTGVWVYHAELRGPKGRLAMLTDWGGVQSKDFRNSDKLLSAFDPAGIVALTKEMANTERRRLQRHVDMKPRMQEIAGKTVDTAEVKTLETRVAALTAETRIEEVKYAEQTAKAGANHFALLDDKNRNLVVDAVKPLTGQFQFRNAGRQYASTWGAPAGRARIEGTDKWGDRAYFEANDMDTDAAVIVQAIQPPKEEGGAEKPWQVERVFARTGDGVKQMRDDITPYMDVGKPVDDLALRLLTKDLNADLAAHGLTGKITVRAVRKVATASGITFPNASGLYQSGGIQISAKAESPKGTMRHEIIHALRDSAVWDLPYGLFMAREWVALERAAYADRGIRASVLERYPDLDPEMQREEMVAELYRLWADGRDESGTVGRALERILGFLEAVANLLRGRGFISASQVMEQIANGTIGGAAPTPPRGPGGGIKEQRGADKTDTPAFKEWFGDSKVVDAAGKPMVVYHGGPDGIEAFESSTWKYRDSMVGEAAKRVVNANFFTSSRSVAETYRTRAEGRPDAQPGVIYEAYLRMENPLDVDWKGKKFRLGDQADLIERAKEGGHDGVVIRNVIDDVGQKVQPATVYVTFAGEQIKSVNNRGTFDPDTSNIREMRDGGMLPSLARRKFASLLGSAHWKNPEAFVSNALTDSMAGKNGINTLALVPGRALFAELGKRLMSAKTYLRAKEEMDALRNDWHARADEVAQVWRKARAKDPRANDALMDLMHRSTLSGVDPSKPDTWKHGFQNQAEREVSRLADRAPKWAQDVLQQVENHKRSYATLKARYDALPEDMKAIYRRVRAEYDKLGDDFEKAVLENIQAGLKVALKRAQKAYRKEIQRIRDDALHDEEKAQAMLKAQATLDAVKARGGYGAKAKIAALRKQFESNRLKGPYFPLARFGQFFVTIRNDRGEVTSFSRFEKESQQQAFIREQKQAGETNIQFGVLSDAGKLREQVDPAFVADVEGVLADAGASEAVMDAIWQRWLETLPDTSIRTAKIHRKGREGWNQDAFRAFGSHMFHGAHQLARLKYGLELEEALNDAEDEARVAEDPNRAGLIVNEMRRRHDFTMNPQGSSIVAGMSSLAFVWYLGATPAAALANVSQTTVMGPGIMAARFQKAGMTGALREIGRAMADFTKGRGDAQKAPGITQDEHAALTEAYRRGTIDKTQAHDLASVAETGIEYNATRENIMRKIGWFFHQAERMNREVTFLANYRLARAEGLRGDDAIDAAADITWKIHFDYQNTSRPRFMQNDMGKALTVFRQYSVNLAYRMFRDAQQSLRGATKEERAEARTQLVGVTLSMMLHAGIKGTYGYGIIMLLLSMFFPGDSDDIEEWLQDALLMEGDGLGTATWNYIMGAALNGVPGQILGADLSERIGSPNIWFRGPSSDLEGEDVVMHYVTELLGPPLGIALGIGRGMQLVSDGEVYRGVEAAVPKVVRDVLKAGRYGMEGVETISGDDLLENVNPYQLLLQASGFTPAEVSERFDMNSRLKNKEREIMDERKGIHKAAADALLAGEEIPASVLADIEDFNRRFPEYPITAKTIRASAQGRQRAHASMEGGVSLNKRLSARLREGLAPAVYQ